MEVHRGLLQWTALALGVTFSAQTITESSRLEKTLKISIPLLKTFHITLEVSAILTIVNTSEIKSYLKSYKLVTLPSKLFRLKMSVPGAPFPYPALTGTSHPQQSGFWHAQGCPACTHRQASLQSFKLGNYLMRKLSN